MRINFFEEYPIDENMSKLDLIDWPSTIFIAAQSLDEYEQICSKYNKKYPHITFGWWPIIPDSYWISGLANPRDVNKLLNQLSSTVHKNKLPILIDFELPIKKHLYIKNIFHIYETKKVISKFFADSHQYKLKIYTAEYPSINKFTYYLWKMLGISPSFSLDHTKIPMCYSSMKPRLFGNMLWKKVKIFENKLTEQHPNRINFGLGVITNGVFGNEPILSLDNLKNDLEWAKSCDIPEVFIFRLGGIDESHTVILKQFLLY